MMSEASLAGRRLFLSRMLMRAPSAPRTVHYRLLAVFWTIGILLVVTIPTGTVPEVDSALGLDKIVHAVLFGGFGILWLRGLCPPGEEGLSSGVAWRAPVVLAVGILFALATEVYQHVAPIERVGSTYDAAADLVGLLVAFGGYYTYHQHSWNRTSVEQRAE